jgi:hypothetical protein
MERLELPHHRDLLLELLPDRRELVRHHRRRLHDEVERAELERLEDVGLRGASGDDEHRRRLPRHDEPEEREAVHLRHLEIERHEIGLLSDHEPQRLFAVAGLADDVDAGDRREDVGDRAAVERRVVDDDDAQRRPSNAAARRAARGERRHRGPLGLSASSTVIGIASSRRGRESIGRR